MARRLSAGDSVNLYDIGLRITHQELAGMISSTRETTSLALNELRKAGFIDYDRTCFIVNTTAITKEIE
ncbi:winged helix-turn-helix domain-containing protein [Candidatus Saccharibacteria bacterium]|nr:winged helix-turn-helix domain-containing protein [Candidatus Saccharibacteria bacterium]